MRYTLALIILVLLFSPFLYCRLNIPAVTAAEPLVFLTLFVSLFKDVKRGSLSLQIDILEFSFAIFLLFTSMQILFGATIYPYATEWGLIRAFSSISLFLLIKNYFNNEKDVYRLIKAILFAATSASVMAIAQKAIDPSTERYAFFLNRNHFAGYLEMAFGLALGAFLYKLRRLRPGERSFFLIGMALMGFSIFMTSSRAGIAVFLISMLFFFTVLGRNKRAWLALFIAIATALLALWVFYEPIAERFAQLEEAIGSRMKIYSAIVRLIRDYPLFGTGFNTFEYAFARYQPNASFKRFNYGDNDYLQLVSETGLVVTAVIFACALIFLARSYKIIRKAEDRFIKYIGCGSLTAVFAIILHSFVDFNLRIHSNAILFFAAAGVLAAATQPARLATYGGEASPPPRSRRLPPSPRLRRTGRRRHLGGVDVLICYSLITALFILLFTVFLLENAAFFLSKKADLESAEIAARISPLNGEYRYLASRRAPNLKTALAYAREASALNPLYHKYKHNLARIYYSLGMYDKAEVYYKEYIELDPNNCYPYLHFAFYYFNRAAAAEANREFDAFLNRGASLYRKAKSLNPNLSLWRYKDHIPVFEDVYRVLEGG